MGLASSSWAFALSHCVWQQCRCAGGAVQAPSMLRCLRIGRSPAFTKTGCTRAQVDEPGVWTELGHAQLEAGAVNDAIGSYLRSGDSSRYLDVIARSQVGRLLRRERVLSRIGRMEREYISGCLQAAVQMPDIEHSLALSGMGMVISHKLAARH